MNIKNFLILLFSILTMSFSAQIKDPVKFQLKINELGNNLYEAVLIANLEKNWHIYSKDIPEDSGIPTEMILSGKNIEVMGKVTEIGKKIDEYSEAFGTRIVYYSNKVSFVQKFKLKDASKTANITVEITYQTCDDRVCLAPNTLEFEQKIENRTIPEEENSEEGETTAQNNNIKASISNSSIIKLNPKNIRIESLDHKNPLTDCGLKT